MKDKRILTLEFDDVISVYESYTRDELIAELDRSIEKVPAELRDSVRFEISDAEYPKLGVRWMRPETDREMNERLATAKQVKKLRELRERAEFERLQEIYGDKKK